MEYDIIIIGSGMVGATLAYALSLSSYRIAVIDASPSEPANDHRFIALNYGSYCFFKKLNLWENLKEHATAINQVHVSSKGHFGITRLSATEAGLETLGYVVPAKFINQALLSALSQQSNVTFYQPMRLDSILNNDSNVKILLSSQQELTAKLVIAADGSHSTVRKLLNTPTSTVDYNQTALVTTMYLQHDHAGIAYERFIKNSAIALLPLTPENGLLRAAFIWTDNSERISQLLQMTDSDFLAEVQKNFGYRLGRFLQTGPRFSYPLHSIQAEEQSHNRIMLLGNALHTLHPVAAQGLNLALFEIAALSEWINLHSLDKAPHFKLPKQTLNQNLSDKLNWLFSVNIPLAAQARQLGMIGLDNFLPVKKYFIDQLAGKKSLVQDKH